jgi:RHS repeat-associated protein
MLSFDEASLTYNPNGNLASRTDACGTTDYTWDARNRLIGISGYHDDCSPLAASFSYDALNRRIGKTVDGITTQNAYDGWDIIQEATGGVTTDYTRTLNIDEPLAFERSDGTARYYKADALGSIIALLDGDGNMTTSYAYDAFGKVAISGSDANPFQYAGRESDGTGLYYYRMRYFSPEMRRFVSEDPIRLAGGMNFYAYVQNNPINHIDPFGLIDWEKFFKYTDSIERHSTKLSRRFQKFEQFLMKYSIGKLGLPTPKGIGKLGRIGGGAVGAIIWELGNPTELSDPYFQDGSWYWPDGTPLDPESCPSDNTGK